MQRFLRTLLLLLLAAGTAWAQTGKITGVVRDQATKEPVPFATLRVLQAGTPKATAVADVEGAFKTAPLEPGKYDVEASYLGYKTIRLSGVVVSAERSTPVTLALTSSSLTTEEIELVAYKVPVIDKDNTSTGRRLTAEDIKNMPTRDLNTIAASTPGVYSADERGGLNIRGNRSGDNATFVNGVRVYGTTLPPAEALEEAQVITGGVPAQYGDVLGGVLSYTTKNAAQRFSAGVIAETSRLFDKWNYDLLGLTFSGPIIKTKDTTGRSRTLVGYFLNLQYQGYKTFDPSPYGFWRLSDNSMNQLRDQPWIWRNGGALNRGQFFTQNDLTNQSWRPNDQRHDINLNTTIDFQPSANTILSVGGNANYRLNNNGSTFNLANYENNSRTTTFDFNTFVRFRQTFNNTKDDQNDLVKNIYYQVQFDVSRLLQTTKDPRLGDGLSKYNYYGKFTERFRNDTITGPFRQSLSRVDPLTGQVDSLYITSRGATGGQPARQVVLLNQNAGLTWEPSNINPALANYNTKLFQLYQQQGIDVLNIPGLATLQNLTDGVGLLGPVGLNGRSLSRIGYSYREKGSTFGNFNTYGVTISDWTVANQDQFRATLQMGADVGRHTVRFGLEAMQRFVSSYDGVTNIYNRGRGLLNRQVLGADAGLYVDTFTTRVTNASGTTIDYLNVRTRRTVNRDANGNVLGQTDFDRNLRRNLGLDPNGSELLNIDALDPNRVNINLFSVGDIMNDGLNPMATWQGYDAYGNRRPLFGNRTSFSDFFTDTVNRPVDAFRPIYLAGYIEDKFEIEDLIIRLGVRVDRFDANQQVLRDRYSLTRLRTVGETDMTQFANNYQRPGNIGDDYVIYVDRSADQYNGSNQNQFRVLGFRNGDQWFRADGSPTTNARELEVAGQVLPWYDVTGITDPILQRLQASNRITLDAFTPYKPQWVVSPRIAFSFPISEDALFFAHYDILTQRPSNYAGGANFASPRDYYALSRQGSYIYSGAPQAGAYIPNPNLLPQRKIDYQVGFQQKLTQSSALKFSAYYQEIKDLIQIVRISQAFPVTYTTDANQDFGVSKGLTLEYDLRRTENLTFNGSYTLQFAETSASSFAASQLAQTNNPNLRNTVPASYDSRHGLKFSIDYRFGPKDGPTLFGSHFLENAGVNLLMLANSGTPYTRYQNQFFGTNVEGAVNGNRLPWNYRLNMRINKTFFLGGKTTGEGEARRTSRRYAADVYMYVQNLLDRRNVLGVYNRTGSSTDDGYLRSSLGAQEAQNAQNPASYNAYYNLWILNPDFVTLPRWWRIGVNVSF